MPGWNTVRDARKVLTYDDESDEYSNNLSCHGNLKATSTFNQTSSSAAASQQSIDRLIDITRRQAVATVQRPPSESVYFSELFLFTVEPRKHSTRKCHDFAWMLFSKHSRWKSSIPKWNRLWFGSLLREILYEIIYSAVIHAFYATIHDNSKFPLTSAGFGTTAQKYVPFAPTNPQLHTCFPWIFCTLPALSLSFA